MKKKANTTITLCSGPWRAPAYTSTISAAARVATSVIAPSAITPSMNIRWK